MEIAAAFIAGIMLIGTMGWLIGKKTMFVTILNSLLGGIMLFTLSIFQLLSLTSSYMFVTGLLGVLGVIIIFFLN